MKHPFPKKVAAHRYAILMNSMLLGEITAPNKGDAIAEFFAGRKRPANVVAVRLENQYKAA